MVIYGVEESDVVVDIDVVVFEGFFVRFVDSLVLGKVSECVRN